MLLAHFVYPPGRFLFLNPLTQLLTGVCEQVD